MIISTVQPIQRTVKKLFKTVWNKGGKWFPEDVAEELITARKADVMTKATKVSQKEGLDKY